MPSRTPFKWDEFHPHGRLLCQILNDFFGNSNWPQRQQMFNEAAESELVGQGFPNGIQEADRVASQFRESNRKSYIWDEIRGFENGDDSQRALYQMLFDGLVAVAAAEDLPGPSKIYEGGGGFVQTTVPLFKAQMASEVVPGRNIPPRTSKARGKRRKVASRKGSSKRKANIPETNCKVEALSSTLPPQSELGEEAEEGGELISDVEYESHDDEEATGGQHGQPIADQNEFCTMRSDTPIPSASVRAASQFAGMQPFSQATQRAAGSPAPSSLEIDHEQGEDEEFDAYRLRIVRTYESGEIVNEHYSQQDYKNKRLWFLDRHPLYGPNVKLFPKIKQELADVFASGVPKLSMQAVRRLELENQVDPLTPLTMTGNLQTLDDDFSGYPDREWTPEMEE